MSWDIIWQPGHVTSGGIVTMTDDLVDVRETTGCRDLIIPDELMPLDLQ